MRPLRLGRYTGASLILAGALLLTGSAASIADEKKPGPMQANESNKGGDKSQGKEASTESKGVDKNFDVPGVFRSICGFCHEDGGRRAGKGPQLMNSEKTDQELFNRIKNGLPGRMAAFGGAFTDDQIRAIVVYIRNLKPH